MFDHWVMFGHRESYSTCEHNRVFHFGCPILIAHCPQCKVGLRTYHGTFLGLALRCKIINFLESTLNNKIIIIYRQLLWHLYHHNENWYIGDFLEFFCMVIHGPFQRQFSEIIISYSSITNFISFLITTPFSY